MKKIRLFLTIAFFVLLHYTRANVWLIMDNQQAAQGSQITVPIKVKDFINIISVQGTIQFNPLLLSYVSVQNFGLPDMNFNSFGTTQSASGKITFSWYETQLIGQNLPDSAVIFSFKFNVIGNSGQTSPLTFSNTPTALEIINAAFVTQNVSASNGSVLIQSQSSQQAVTLFMDTITAPANSQVIVSARVKDFININSLQGTLQFNPAIVTFENFTGFGLPNLSAGNFGTSLISSGKITFSWNDSSFSGINKPDSTAIFSMIFHLIGNPGQQSPLDFVSIPTALEIADSLNNVLNYNLHNGFIKISGHPSSNELIIKMDTAIGPQGSMVDIAVRSWNFDNIVSMQGTIGFNKTIAAYDTISMYGLTGMSIAGFGTTQINNGKLMFSWSDPSMTGVTLADSSVLFKVRFHLVGTAGSFTMLDFINTPTPLEFSDNTYTPITAQYISGKAIVSGDAGLVLNEPSQLSYCVGNTINVSYTATGIFIQGNLFILQLSDASGNFASPINIDTVASITSGTFSGLIPLYITTGTGYHLRAISTNPGVMSNVTTNNISIYQLPAAPAKPVGIASLCANPSNTTYTTHHVANAVSYNWVLHPANAGVLTATDTSAVVNWNNTYTGNAYIKVSASNSSCTGPYSDSLLVVILPYPATPNKPLGDTLLCLNPSNSTYTISAVTNATSYAWILNPSTAGTVAPNGTSAVVNWNNTFTGVAYIKVSASNGSCQGSYSDSLKVKILTYPGVPNVPQGDTLLCINPPNSTYATNTVAGATGYIWKLTPTSAGTVTPSGQTAVVNWNNTFFGTVTIKVKATNQICESSYSPVLHITINNPFPAPVKPQGDTSFCENPPNATYYTHHITGATSYIWTINPSYAGTISGTDTVLTVDWDNSFAGAVHIFVSATNGICNGLVSDSLTVNIYPYPSAPVATNVNVCLGSPVPALTASGTGTIQWYSDTALTTLVYTGASFSTGHTAIGTYTYYVIQTIHGCQSPTTTVILTIHPVSAAPVSGGNQHVCFGSPVPDLTATGTDTIKWYSNSALTTLVHTGSPFPTGLTVPGTYSYYAAQINSNNCQSPSVTVTLTINVLPSAPAASNVFACSGTPVPDLTATGTAIQWYSDTTLTNLLHTGNTFTTGQTANGIYTYYVTQTVNNCESPATTVTLTISTAPASPIANNAASCFGNLVPDLTATGTGVIKWYSDIALTQLIYTGATFTTAHTAIGIYTYYVTQTISTCQSTATPVTLTIYALPSAPVSGGNQQVCFGSPVPDLTATGTDTIKWYSNSSLTTLVHTGSSFATGQTAVGNNTYYVTQINGNNCQSSSIIITLSIHSIPSAPAANNVDACFGSSIPNLTATGTSIHWYSDAGLTNLVHTGNSFATGQTATGSYIYYVTQTVSGCESPATTVVLVIHDTPVAPTASNVDVCFGSPVPGLTASGTGTIKWYSNSALTNLVFSGTPFITGQIAAGSYTYYVTQTISNCQSAAAVVTLTIHSLPSAPLSVNQQACFGSAIPDLTASGTDTIKWYSNPSLTTLVHTGIPFATGQTAIGTHTYYVTQTNSNNCVSPATTVSLTINAIPAAPTASDKSSCFGSPVPNLTATGTGVIKWYSDISLTQLVYTGASFATAQSAIGIYTYYVTQTISTCQSNATPVVLTIYASPSAPNKPSGDTLICQNTTSTTYISSGVAGATGYIWKLNPSGAGVVSASDTSSTIYWTSGFSGNAHLSLYATNGTCNSSYSDSLLIHIQPLPLKPHKPIGDSVICQGTISTSFSSTAQNAITYQWVLIPSSAGSVSGNSSSIYINWTSGFSGTVKLYVSGANLCGNGVNSDTLIINISPTPSQPVISVNGLVLTSSYPNSNQWYYNGNIIPNATGNTYTTTQNGYYYVVYTSSNGCISASDSIHIITVSIAPDETSEIFKLYPNPTSGIFYIDASIKPVEKIVIQDILGREIYVFSNLKTVTTVDLSSETTGVYLVKIYYSGLIMTRKIVKL